MIRIKRFTSKNFKFDTIKENQVTACDIIRLPLFTEKSSKLMK